MAAPTIPTVPPQEQRDPYLLPEEHLVPVYVWELPVRLSHWMIVGSLVVLSVTGFYMHGSFLIASGQQPWSMGSVRFIHEIAGFILLAALILRAYWFEAGNTWARWRAFWPITRGQWTALRSMLRYYTFRQRKPFEQIGHNPLAGITYIVIYSLLWIECITGLLLYSRVEGSAVLGFLIGWIPRLIDISWVYAIHYFVMFLLIAFLIHHVYSAVLVAVDERNAEMESIFSGFKFMPDDIVQEEMRRAALEPHHLFKPRKIVRGRL